MNEFHDNGVLPKAITFSFIALVPKNKSLQSLAEYRPISLVGSRYKILPNVLAGRLRKVLRGVISNMQNAFLPKRLILDRVAIVNEPVDWAKRCKKSCLRLKVYFEKAYD